MTSPFQIFSPLPSDHQIVLRPWRDEDFPLAFVWMQSCWRLVSNDFSPTTIEDFVAMKRSQDWHRLGVYRDGELGGILEAEHISPVVAQVHVCFKRSFWGRSTTLPALKLGAEYLWRHGYEKLWCIVHPDNRLIISTIKAFGGIAEGVLRSHTRRGGRLVDMLAFAVLRER